MKIEHIALYVNDLDAARCFFTRYLGGISNDGYHNPRTDFRSFFISFDDGARLELMTKPELAEQKKPLNRTGYAHIAFSVGSKERVDALTDELRSAGFEVVSGPRTTGDGYFFILRRNDTGIRIPEMIRVRITEVCYSDGQVYHNYDGYRGSLSSSKPDNFYEAFREYSIDKNNLYTWIDEEIG